MTTYWACSRWACRPSSAMMSCSVPRDFRAAEGAMGSRRWQLHRCHGWCRRWLASAHWSRCSPFVDRHLGWCRSTPRARDVFGEKTSAMFPRNAGLRSDTLRCLSYSIVRVRGCRTELLSVLVFMCAVTCTSSMFYVTTGSTVIFGVSGPACHHAAINIISHASIDNPACRGSAIPAVFVWKKLLHPQRVEHRCARHLVRSAHLLDHVQSLSTSLAQRAPSVRDRRKLRVSDAVWRLWRRLQRVY